MSTNKLISLPLPCVLQAENRKVTLLEAATKSVQNGIHKGLRVLRRSSRKPMTHQWPMVVVTRAAAVQCMCDLLDIGQDDGGLKVHLAFRTLKAEGAHVQTHLIHIWMSKERLHFRGSPAPCSRRMFKVEPPTRLELHQCNGHRKS